MESVMARDTANLTRLFPGDSEMARRMREFDWSNTPLGASEKWPQNLASSVRLMLNSRYPMFVWWGRELINFYNGAYIPVLGARHPEALGFPASRVWAEIWDILGPQTEIVMNESKATWNESVLLVMERYGYTEETYFTFSYSPVIDDQDDVGGVFCACTEDTKRIIGERRLRLLRALAEHGTQAKTAEEACAIAAATMRNHLYDLSFAFVYLLDPDGAVARLAGATTTETPVSPPVIRLSGETDGVWPFRELIESGRNQIEISLDAKFGRGMRLPGGAWPEPARQAVVLRMAKPGQEQPSGFLVAGVSPRLLLDEDYRFFLELAAGQVAMAIGNARAYEEERKRVEALAQIDRAKTVFFSNISHEFRTPLTLILGPAEEILSGTLGETSEIQRTHLTTLRGNALRLQKLVNTLLDFSRVEAGRIDASYEPVDLGLLSRDLASTFCSAVHRAGLLFVMNCPSIEEPVYVDRDMWEKIVLNLLSNALKFTLEGAIEVSVKESVESRVASGEREESGEWRVPSYEEESGEPPLTTRHSPPFTPGYVVLTVRDTGVGIPAEGLPHLFERFYRVHGTRARTQEGSGIGLALVQELVKLHGGTIQVESQLDQGTTFTVSIPKGSAHLPQNRISAPRALSSTALGAAPFIEEALRWLPDPMPAAASSLSFHESSSAAGTTPIAASSQRILIAEDNSDMGNYLKRLLEPHWQVVVAADGARALEIARAQRPDLVLSDIMMPGLDGFELLQRLRADERTSAIPVILLSARAGEEAKVEGLNAGADDYLIKPFTAKELLARVEAHLKLQVVRREAARALRESEERYRRLVTLLPVAVYTCEAPSGVITFYNDRAAELWGRAPKIRDTDERFCGSFKLWRPDGTSLPHRDTPMALAVREGREFRNEEVVIERPDGTRITVVVNIDPIRDDSGHLVGAINVFQDATAWKRAQNALWESEQRFRSMADSSPVMIWVTDAAGHAAFLSQTYLDYVGIAADAIPTFDWRQIVHADDRPAYVAGFETALQNGEAFHHRARVRRCDGQWRWFECRGNPLYDNAGNMTGYIGSSLDITEIYESQQRLRELDQRKDEFLANMSHEIRSPLTGIMGYADILLTQLKDPEHIKYLKTIKESGEYLIEIVNDILDLSKIEAGKLVLNIESISVHAVLAEVHGLMNGRAREKNLPLSLRYEGPLPERIHTDRTRLRQILINLVSNAVKFTERGRVEIVAKSVEDVLRVEVIDTGVGIALEHQETLFQPFTQADATSTRSYGGTGLGLTITKRLVEMLGGTISFESELGKGSMFRVTIPARAAQADGKKQAAAAPVSAKDDALPLRNLHILTVDDREEFCYLVSRYVQDAGGRATAVYDGQSAIEALEKAKSDPFHAVIMDIQMPGMDGYETTRRLRSKGFHTPIIALTAGAMVGDREKCLKAGCDDYLTKPIDRRALVAAVAHHGQKALDRLSGKLKVLVVDDSHGACELLRRYLEKRGHEVCAAHDGESAFHVAQQFRPDVFVLDIRLPDINGYELMQRFRQMDGIGRAKFIAMSGYGADGAADGSPRFDHFLEKPLDLDRLGSLLSGE
jgi:PAS domain S-box-containing protein